MPKRTNPDKTDSLVLALTQGEPINTWARLNDVSERTAYRWARQPEVRRRVDELRAELLDRAVARLAEAAQAAATTLWVLLGADNPPAIRLGAARAVLADLIAVQNHAALSRRVAELEARINGTASDADMDADEEEEAAA